MIDFKDAAELLQKGAIGLLPSDTIYGISCRALDKKAVQRIYKLKGRNHNKPFIILLSDVGQASELGIEPDSLQPVAKYWPAPLTVIVPAPNAPAWLSRGQATLAVRIPANAQLRKLIAQTSPIVSTSANPEGQEPAQNVSEAKAYFGRALDFYVDQGNLTSQASTIAKLSNGQLEVIRPGAFRL